MINAVSGILLSYYTLGAAVVLCIAAAVLLIAGRRRLPRAARAALTVLLIVLAVWLAFVCWAVIASGRPHPAAAPVTRP